MDSERLNQPVRDLQAMLRVIGRNQGNLPPVAADGVYGSQTERAVRSFQRSCGLPVTGVADRDTWDRLVQEYSSSRTARMEAAPLQIILQPGQTITPGSRNRHLYLIQGMLKALSEVYPNLPQVEVTGIHDDRTQAAVRFLRGCADCAKGAVIDKAFYATLAELYRSAAGDGTVR